MQKAQIQSAYQLAAHETIPPLARGHLGDWWFRKGVATAPAPLGLLHSLRGGYR